MAFRPNYHQDRVNRQRTARDKQADKQRRLEEKTAQRKAARAAAAASTNAAPEPPRMSEEASPAALQRQPNASADEK